MLYHTLRQSLVKEIGLQRWLPQNTCFYLYLYCPFVATGHSNARDDGGGTAERGEEGEGGGGEERKMGRNVR